MLSLLGADLQLYVYFLLHVYVLMRHCHTNVISAVNNKRFSLRMETNR